MQITEFLTALDQSPESLTFADTLAVIDAHYGYRPTVFRNGNTENAAGTNEGSCKVFAFGLDQQLDKEQTLACFAQFYRDVLATPTGDDHQNIRNFMVNGWEGIQFEGQALTRNY